MSKRLSSDYEVSIRAEHSKAVIEGKTAVPFKTLVTLILERRVLGLFKNWSNEPVIINTTLLTDIASTEQDINAGKSHYVLVTLGSGIVVGIFLAAFSQLLLSFFSITFGKKELFFVSGSLLVIGLLVFVLARTQQKTKQAEKVVETMDKISMLFSKK